MCNYASGTLLLAMVCLAHALPGRQPQKEVLMLEELPLYVIATQPAGLADQYDGEPIMVKGKQPLTVVFSRPVVNLMGDPNSQTKAVFFFEPEIPGNFTWSSSFIVHFSPEQNWPLENVLKLRWYSSISSFDGANLIRDTDTDGIVELITPNLTLSLELVVLDQSRKSTDSGWDANVGTPLDILPEVPPNARVFLGFSYPVSLKSLRDHFQVYQDEQPVDLGLKVSTCNMAGAPDSQIQDPNFVEQETSCIIVTFENTQPGARFTLALGAGTKISNNSGLLVDDLSVSFGGLRSFTIPFVEQPIMGFFNITHSALNVWLPHGLSEGNTIADLKQQMSIVTNKTGEEVDFDLSLRGRSICRLVADFVPGESYRIQVAPSSSVLDEYGQPLQQSSLILYTDPVEPLFEPLKPRAQKVSIYESNMNWGKAIIALYNGGNLSDTLTICSDKDIRAWGISSDLDIRRPLSVLQSSTGKGSLETLLGKKDVFKVEPPPTNLADVIRANASEAIEESGVLATEFCRSDTFTYHLVVETNLQVAVVGWGSSSAMIWITSMENGNPIKSATVRLYNSSVDGFQSEPLGPGNFTEVETGITDNTGRIQLSEFASGLHASVEHKGKLLYIPDLKHIAPPPQKDIYDVFMLAQAILRPRETLFIHGYVMKLDRSSLQPFHTLMAPQLTVSPALGVDNAISRFPLYVTEGGGFVASIPIPNDASPGLYTVQFEAAEVLGSFQNFRVVRSWPVKPIIEVETPEWVYSSSNLTTTATVRSSIGVPIAGVQLNVSYAVVGPPHMATDDHSPAISEIMETGGQGRINYTVDLSRLNPPPAPGSMIVTTVSWKREIGGLLERKTISRLEVADLVLRIHRTVATNVPGQKFSLRVSGSTLKGSPVSVDVVVRLKEPDSPQTVARITENPIRGETLSNCTVKTGEVRYNCRFELPSMGRFILEACSEGSNRVCHSEPLGWTKEEWERMPLASHLSIGLVILSPAPRSIHKNFQFALENPYKNSSALLLWGSSLRVKSKIIKLKDEALSEFNLFLGEECAGNCVLSAIIAVPRQPSLPKLVKYRVLTSKLFDPLMPHLGSADLDIPIAQNRSVVVSMDIPELGCCNPAAPGENLTLVVTSGEQDPKAQAVNLTVVASQRPLPEESPLDLAARFNLDLSLEFSKTMSSDYLIAPQTEEVLTRSFLNRIKVDPWAAPFADEFGMNVELKTADLSVDEYLSVIATPITVIPSWLAKDEPVQATQHSSEIEVNTVSPDLAYWTAKEYNISRVVNGTLGTSLLLNASVTAGKNSFSFKAPVSPGDYFIRAYTAHSGVRGGGVRFGSSQLILRVHNPYNYNVTAPRFVRVNDAFDVLVQLSDALRTSLKVTVGTDSETIFELDGNGNKLLLNQPDKTQVRFKVYAPGLGKGTLKILAGGREEEITINVLGKQEPVRYLNVSRVSAGDSFNFLPAITGAGTVPLADEEALIHLGVGELPSFMSFLTDFYLRHHKTRCPLTAEYLLSSVILHVVGISYNIWDVNQSHLDPDTIDALASISDLTFALETLESMTANTLGLRSVAFCQGSSESSLPTIAMNGKAAALIQLLDALPNIKELMGEQYSRLAALLEAWKEALMRLVLSELSSEGNSLDLATFAIARAGLGSDLQGDSEDLARRIGRKLKGKLLELDIDSQAYYILAHNPSDSSIKLDVKTLSQKWAVDYQQGTSLGYIPSINNLKTPTTYMGNVLALMVLLRAELTQSRMVSGLANFVRSPPLGRDGLHELLDIDRATAMIALRLYDHKFASDKVTGLTILGDGWKGSFNSPETDLISVSLRGRDAASGSKDLIKIEGDGELSVAVLATIVPQTPYPNPLYQGVFLERFMQTTGKIVEMVDAVPVGSVVTVLLQVMVPVDSKSVLINVPMPGGLEALQTQSGSTQSMAFCLGKDLDLEDLNCYVQEIKLSSVVFQFKALSKGAHVVQFSALAARVGEFFFPPSKAFVTSEPTLVGFSNSESIRICSRETESCGSGKLEERQLPIACPNSCNSNGACDLRRGKCICRHGFENDSCSLFSL